MRILLSNDDGVAAAGLFALAEEFSKDNEVIVCAPDSERSACSHSISIYSPLRIKKYNIGVPVDAYSCSGTPADSVLFALSELYNEKPDLIISGVNSGANLGQSVMYSGTVSAAFEGAINGIRSVAISLVIKNKSVDYKPAVNFLSNFIKTKGLDVIEKGTVLNINVPSNDNTGKYKVCSLGMQPYNTAYEKREDTSGKPYYWINYQPFDNENIDEATDIYNINQGYITLTPLKYNIADETLLNKLKERV